MKGKKRVLIVDHHVLPKPSLDGLFAQRRYEVERVDSVDGAILALATRSFDVVLIHGGHHLSPAKALLRWLCSSYPETVVVVTGLGNDLPLAIDLLKSGARECLTEALSPPELVEAVEATLTRHFRAVRPWYDQSVRAIAAAIGLRDVETVEHCQRVATTTERLCRALGIKNEKFVQSVRWGAYLHDVGKVGLPDTILHKPGPLNDDEAAQMRRHPEVGRALLDRIPFLADSIPVVLYHHERFDGSGYPEGLRGDEIPLEARAIAVADTVDAMLSNRPYRPALTWGQVEQELRHHSGDQFDPDVVHVALERSYEVFAVYELNSDIEEVPC